MAWTGAERTLPGTLPAPHHFCLCGNQHLSLSSCYYGRSVPFPSVFAAPAPANTFCAFHPLLPGVTTCPCCQSFLAARGCLSVSAHLLSLTLPPGLPPTSSASLPSQPLRTDLHWAASTSHFNPCHWDPTSTQTAPVKVISDLMWPHCMDTGMSSPSWASGQPSARLTTLSFLNTLCSWLLRLLALLGLFPHLWLFLLKLLCSFVSTYSLTADGAQAQS